MKQCPKCCADVQDGSIFCLSCGCILPDDLPEIQPVAEPVFVFEPMITVPEEPAAEPVAAPVVATAVVPAAKPVKKKPRKKLSKGAKIGLIIGSIALLLVAVFLIIGYATNWFGGPLSGMARAFVKTAKANNLTIEFDAAVKYNGSNIIGGTFLNESGKGEFRVAVDRNNRKFAVLGEMPMNKRDADVLIHDGNIYILLKEDDEAASAETKEIPEETVNNIYDLMSGEYFDNDKNLEEILELCNIQADAATFRAFVKDMVWECFTERQWLEKYMGLEKKDNKYCFEFDLDDFIDEIVDRACDADIITKSQKKSWTSIKTNSTVEIEIMVEKGYVTSIEFTMESYGIVTSLDVSLSDINKSDITDEQINAHKHDVTDFIETKCAICDQCGKQEAKQEMTAAGGKYYCSSCSADMATCSTCNLYHPKANMTYLNARYYCSPCFTQYQDKHTCDLCGMMTGINAICYNHQKYDHCSQCDSVRYLDYYHVIDKEYLCYYCHKDRNSPAAG